MSFRIAISRSTWKRKEKRRISVTPTHVPKSILGPPSTVKTPMFPSPLSKLKQQAGERSSSRGGSSGGGSADFSSNVCTLAHFSRVTEARRTQRLQREKLTLRNEPAGALWRARTRSDPPLAAVSGGKYWLARKRSGRKQAACVPASSSAACLCAPTSQSRQFALGKKISLA